MEFQNTPDSKIKNYQFNNKDLNFIEQTKKLNMESQKIKLMKVEEKVEEEEEIKPIGGGGY